MLFCNSHWARPPCGPPFRVLAAASLVVACTFAVPARADWQPGDGHKMHFPQLPDEEGWDVNATAPMVLADDWRCSQTGLVTDIHFWGSWRDMDGDGHGDPGTIQYFVISIHDDIPADQSPTGYSMPGNTLREWMLPAQAVPIDPPSFEAWYDPAIGSVLPNDHQEYFQYNITNLDTIVPDPFTQIQNTIYWLNISAVLADPPGSREWGWKSSRDHFNDDAVWATWGNLNWIDIYEPPRYNQFNATMDFGNVLIAGGGTNFFGEGWYFYPEEGWWNIWFYDNPFTYDHFKDAFLSFDVYPLDPGNFFELAVNWSTDVWSFEGNPPGQPRHPPLPGVDELLYIGRQPLFAGPIPIGGQHFDLPFQLLDYNPEWISVDIRGENFAIENGTIRHECVQTSLDLAFVITGACRCDADVDGDGILTVMDFAQFLSCFGSPPVGFCASSDINCDGVIDFLDFIAFHCLWYGNSPNYCCQPNVGACCLPTQECRQLTAADCALQLGTYYGDGSTCGNGQTLNAEGCCYPDGTCGMADPMCCAQAAGLPQGAGTVCTASEACCLPGGGCSDVDPLCCDDSGGVSQGPGSDCTVPGICTDLCPVPPQQPWCQSLQSRDCQITTVTDSCLPTVVRFADPLTPIVDLCDCILEGSCGQVEMSAAPQGGYDVSCPGPCPAGQRCQLHFDGIPTGLDSIHSSAIPAGSTVRCACDASAIEACCVMSGPAPACQDLTPAQCLAIMGAPQGAGTSCNPGDEQPCCIAGGTICLISDPVCCDDLGGGPSPVGAGSCRGDPSGNGIDDACEVLDVVVCEPQGGLNPSHPLTYWYDVTPGAFGRCDFHVRVFDPNPANYTNWMITPLPGPTWQFLVHQVGVEWWASWWDGNPGCPNAFFGTTRFQFDHRGASAWGDWSTTISNSSDPYLQVVDRSVNHPAEADGYGYRVHGPMTPPDTEACCLPEGRCVDVEYNKCIALGGDPQGPATNCLGWACNPLKWAQPPTYSNTSPMPVCYWGWNELSHYQCCQILADDWACSSNQPITDVHWWGSYEFWDQPGPPPFGPGYPDLFHIGIWTDVPRNIDQPFSHPGRMVWQWIVPRAMLNERAVGCDFYPDYPRETCFRYDFHIPEAEWFYQAPSTVDPTVYWVSISAWYPGICTCEGDVDDDGDIDFADAARVIDCMNGLPVECGRADVNCDGAVNMTDANAVQCLMQGLPPDQCCPGSIQPQFPWGWKTREHFFNDDAVIITSPNAPVLGSEFAEGDELVSDDGTSWDMAFVLTTNTPPRAKWEQLPDPNLPGLHAHDGITLADNWECTGGAVTDFHWWGNYELDALGNEIRGAGIQCIHLSIHANDPALPWCLPQDPELWGVCAFFEPLGETFTGLYNSEGARIYRYDFELAPGFAQVPGEIYWLDIEAVPVDPGNPARWRWQEAARDSTPRLCPAAERTPSLAWHTIVWPGAPEPRYSEMAFAVTSAPYAPKPDPVYPDKVRYLSMVVPPEGAGQMTALRVMLDSLHHPDPPNMPGQEPQDFTAFEGEYRYVRLIRDTLGNPVFDCVDSAGHGTTFKCAVLSCTPEYRDWAGELGGAVLHVTGNAVVPSSRYRVAQLASTCAGFEETCGARSPELTLATQRWGDVASPFQAPSPASRSQPSALDIARVVDKVKDMLGAFSKPRAQLQPNDPNPRGAVNATDIAYAVDSVKGMRYTFAGPQPCP